MKKIRIVLAAMVVACMQITAVCQPAWIQKKNLEVTLYRACSFSIDGEAYVGLGANEKDGPAQKAFYRYDPAIDTWTRIADFPGSARYFALAFSLHDKGYVGLGTDGTTRFTDLWEYNPANDEWIQKAEFPAVGRNGAVAIVIGNKGYAGLGVIGSTRFKDWWEYDPADGTNGNDSHGNPKGKWTQREDFGGTARSFAIGFSIPDAGYVGFGNDGTYLNDLWKFDPSQVPGGQWSRKNNLLNGNRSVASAVVIDNKAYITMGNYISNGALHYLRDVWAYDPVNDLWTARTPFSGLHRAAAISFVVNSKAYFGTGYTSNDQLANDLWEFNPLAPMKPELALTTISENQINLLWMDNSDNESGFQIERSINDINNFGVIETTAANTTGAEVKDLSEGTKYYFRIKAINGTYYSDPVIKSAFTLPAAPSTLTATAVSAFEVTLHWQDNSSGEEGYVIERSTSENTSFNGIALTSRNETSFMDTTSGINKVLPGTTYHYRVVAVNEAGLSAYSNEAVTQTFSVPETPSELTAQAGGTYEIQLTWKDDADDETGFLIQRSVSGNTAYADLISLEADVTQYVDEQLNANTAYYYRVKATGHHGNSDYSEEAWATTLITGNEISSRGEEVTVFPNPAGSYVYVDIGQR